MPIVNPFDQLEAPMSTESDILGDSEPIGALSFGRKKARRRSVDLESEGVSISEISSPETLRDPSSSHSAGHSDDRAWDEKLGDWNLSNMMNGKNLSKGAGTKRAADQGRSNAEDMSALRHLASLLVCLGIMYVVSR